MSERLENLLGALVLALADGVSAAVGDVSGHAGAASAALAVLAQEPGLSIEQLRVPLGRTQSATVRLVDQLVADGLAVRREGPDRRSVAIFLTQRGTTAASQVLDRRNAVLRLATTALAPEDRRALEPMLETALAAITTDAAHAERICRLCDVASCPVETCPVEYGTDSVTTQPGRPTPRPISQARRAQAGPTAGQPADEPDSGPDSGPGDGPGSGRAGRPPGGEPPPPPAHA